MPDIEHEPPALAAQIQSLAALTPAELVAKMAAKPLRERKALAALLRDDDDENEG